MVKFILSGKLLV